MQPKPRPSKVEPGVSFKRRLMRLGVSHHGAPTAWVAPSKDGTAKAPKK